MEISLPPALAGRYRSALEHVARRLQDDPAVRAATVSGSILRGEGGPTSDLDLFVVVAGRHRQRRQYAQDGVFVEEFRNPEERILRYFEEGDHLAMHMVGFGEVLFDRDGSLARLRPAAREAHARGPRPLDPATDRYRRYELWDGHGDLVDLASDPGASPALVVGVAHRLAWRAVDYLYAARRRWPVKPKRLLGDLRSWDPGAAGMVERCFAADRPHEAVAALQPLLRALLGTDDLLAPMEWESEPEAID